MKLCLPPLLAQRDAFPHDLRDPSGGTAPGFNCLSFNLYPGGFGFLTPCCFMKLCSLWCFACPRFSGFNGFILSPILPFCFKPLIFFKPLHHPAESNNSLCRASCTTGSLFSCFWLKEEWLGVITQCITQPVTSAGWAFSPHNCLIQT